MARLLLVKHALPVVERSLPPREWVLSADGVQGAQRLANRLAPYSLDAIVSSLERKAHQTAEIVARALSRPCSTLEGLHEQDRTGTPVLEAEAFRAVMRRVFETPSELVFGVETAVDACKRFRAAVLRALGEHAGQTIAIVSHGTVISLFTASIADVDAYELWSGLALPSYLAFSLPDPRLEEVVSTVS